MEFENRELKTSAELQKWDEAEVDDDDKGCNRLDCWSESDYYQQDTKLPPFSKIYEPFDSSVASLESLRVTKFSEATVNGGHSQADSFRR